MDVRNVVIVEHPDSGVSTLSVTIDRVTGFDRAQTPDYFCWIPNHVPIIIDLTPTPPEPER